MTSDRMLPADFTGTVPCWGFMVPGREAEILINRCYAYRVGSISPTDYWAKHPAAIETQANAIGFASR